MALGNGKNIKWERGEWENHGLKKSGGGEQYKVVGNFIHPFFVGADNGDQNDGGETGGTENMQ